MNKYELFNKGYGFSIFKEDMKTVLQIFLNKNINRTSPLR